MHALVKPSNTLYGVANALTRSYPATYIMWGGHWSGPAMPIMSGLVQCIVRPTNSYVICMGGGGSIH